MIDKIVYAGTGERSWAKASRALGKLAGLKISAVEVSRVTGQIGKELLEQRDQQVARQKRNELPAANETPVSIACVETDGGRIRTRAAGEGPGVHEHAWRETKVAALWRMEGPTFTSDPHPVPPRCFLEQQHVTQLVREIKCQRSEAHEREVTAAALDSSSPQASSENAERVPREWPPERIFRTCVATLRDVYGFGPLVAAEAQRRGFYDAPRQVFLGDGDFKNWTVHKLHFPFFTAITDFVHPVTYLYDAAAAVTNSWSAQWEQYVAWMTAIWQGEVLTVISELEEWQGRLGRPAKDTPDSDPRQVVATTLTYLRNNAPRMNYPQYRQDGLPVTSCLVESLIKEINGRVKGTEQFWNRPSALEGEAILQTVAEQLSDGEPLTKFILERPGSQHYRRSTENRPSTPDRPT